MYHRMKDGKQQLIGAYVDDLTICLEDPSQMSDLMTDLRKRFTIKESEGGKIDWLPPAINCTAPAGTCLIFDARVLHGTGVNTTDEPRFVLNAGFMRSYLRQQDNYCLGLRADVLARASDEALRRMGFQASVRGDAIYYHHSFIIIVIYQFINFTHAQLWVDHS